MKELNAGALASDVFRHGAGSSTPTSTMPSVK